MSYVIGVVGHATRADMVDNLTRTVEPEFAHIDNGVLGPGRNHVHVLAHMWNLGGNTDWYVVIEDDAIPVAGFRHQLAAALAAAPTSVVSLYNGTGHPAQYQRRFAEAAKQSDTCWIMHKALRHAVGYAVHRETLPDVLHRMGALAGQGWAPDDAISRWLGETGKQVSYTNPSLCDHADGPPTIKNRTHLGHPTFGRTKPRRAHWTGTRLTWYGPVATV